MPSIQKIVLALTFVASAFAAQISDGQIQQATTPVAVVKQITDGQIQQVTSTPKPVTVAPPVAQITDGQIQQVSVSSKLPTPTTNATKITTPTAPATFTGAASFMSYSKDLVVVAIGAAAAYAVL